MEAKLTDDWLGIESAPRDGRHIKVRYEDGTDEDGVYWAGTRYCMIGAPQGAKGPGWMSSEIGLPVENITHWQRASLPEEPR